MIDRDLRIEIDLGQLRSLILHWRNSPIALWWISSKRECWMQLSVHKDVYCSFFPFFWGSLSTLQFALNQKLFLIIFRQIKLFSWPFGIPFKERGIRTPIILTFEKLIFDCINWIVILALFQDILYSGMASTLNQFELFSLSQYWLFLFSLSQIA